MGATSRYSSLLESIWTQVDYVLGTRITAAEALERPIALRHPYVFYLGHLPAFAWQQARRAVPGTAAINETFEEIFLRGIDPDVDDPSKCHSHPEVPLHWPSWDEVVEFRSCVRLMLKSLIERNEIPGRTIRIIAEHDAMHAETLCYMLVQGAAGRTPRKAMETSRTQKAFTEFGEEWILVKGGLVQLGSVDSKDYDEQGGFENFKWDNELGKHNVQVQDFQVQRHAVTVAQFIEFIDAGGYSNKSYWDDEDWAWVIREKREHPASMQRTKHASDWQVLTIDGPITVATNSGIAYWPVCLSLAEARAYARWLGNGARLPTEAEWMLYAEETNCEHENEHEHELSDTPHDVREGSVSKWGVVGGMGNGWELTTTQFQPFQGFQAMPEYLEYSTDFFDGRHYVLKGASNATHRSLCRNSFRNFYQARYPYVFAKFRLVR